MNVEIINTGSELMLGRVLNTHQQWLCRRLADLGQVVTRQVAVADRGRDIQQAVREALTRADLILTTGGLGPTSDDITRELIAELLGCKLVPSPLVLAHIEAFFAQRNRPRPPKTDVETLVPEGAEVFLNPTGTAPGLALKIPAWENTPAGQSRWLVMLPGPPRELRPMFDASVVPWLQREFAPEIFICRTLRSTGVGESRVQEMVEAALQPLVARGLEIGYCARPGAVDVRLTARGTPAPANPRAGRVLHRREYCPPRDQCARGLGGVLGRGDELCQCGQGIAAGCRRRDIALARRGERAGGPGNGGGGPRQIRRGLRAGRHGHRRP